MLTTVASASDSYLSDSTRAGLLRIQQHLLNDRFDSAHLAADALIALDTSDPLRWVYRAAVYIGQVTDAEEEMYAEQFKATLDTIEMLAGERVAGVSGREAAWMHLCLGHAKAYRSLWESRFGSFTSALKQGLSTRSSYEAGLEADSTLYDLYGGLGMYHYWKSARAGILRWFRIFKDDKDRGVKELYLAADSSVISGDVARNALLYIWLDKKEYDSVIAIGNALTRRFPDGRQFLWPVAQAYYESKQYHKAVETYLALRKRLAADPGNYYNLVECDYSLYRCYDKLGLKADAVRTARSVSLYYDVIPDDTKRRQRSNLNFLRRMAKKEP